MENHVLQVIVMTCVGRCILSEVSAGNEGNEYECSFKTNNSPGLTQVKSHIRADFKHKRADFADKCASASIKTTQRFPLK